MAKIRSFSVRDTSGSKTVGAAGESISLVLTLDEVVTVTGVLNSASVFPSIKYGASPLDPELINFTSYNPKDRTLNFSVTIPSGVSASALTLSGITLANNVTLQGKTGALASSSSLNLIAKYSIDAVAPIFANTNTSFTGSAIENTSPSRTPLFTATATDNSNAVGYRLTGTDASLFNIDSKGLVRFKVAPDYETQSVYNFKVLAVDKYGNSVSKDARVNVSDSNEAVSLAKGLSSKATMYIAKGSLANQGKTVVGDFINDGSTAGITYTASKLPTTVSLVNGTLQGNLASATKFSITVQTSDNVPMNCV